MTSFDGKAYATARKTALVRDRRVPWYSLCVFLPWTRLLLRQEKALEPTKLQYAATSNLHQ